MSRVLSSLLLATALISTPGHAQRAQSGRLAILHDSIARLAQADAFAGTVVAAQNGKVLFGKAYGEAVREWKVANTLESAYKIGSITKQFTAAGILLLQDRGRLRLDEPFCKYYKGCPTNWQPITIRQLLNHTSGIPDIVRLPEFGAIVTLPTTLDETIGRVKALSLEAAPGTRFKYGNTGYLISARIIELLSGQSYADFIAREIYQPLGLQNSGYASDDVLIPNRAFGYRQSNGRVRPADYIDMSIPAGAGSQYATAGDMVKYADALYAGKLLKAASLAEMFKPQAEDYGLGWHVGSRHGTVLEHIGDINGFGAYMMMFPATRTTIVVLSNLEGTRVRDIARMVETAVFGDAN